MPAIFLQQIREELSAVLARTTDETARRHLEKIRHEVEAGTAALSESEARIGAIVQETPLVIVVGFDRQHRVNEWNRAAEEYFGFIRSQARKRRIADLLPVGSEGEKFVELLEHVWRTGLPFGPKEARITLATGERSSLKATLFPLRNAQGEIVEVIGMGVDITERVHAEEALRLSETRFRDLSELSADWFWEMDAELRFTHISGLDKRGVDTSQFIGLHRWDMPIDLSEEAWAAHKATLAAREPFHDFEYRLRRPDGSIRWLTINGMPLYEDGKFAGYRGTGRDITVRRRLEDELRDHRDHLAEMVSEQTSGLLRAKIAAERASQAKSEFLANMSHELRTPMHAILSFARIGLSKAGAVDTERIRGYFEHIRASGERLLELVNDLLDLSKHEAGRMQYAMGFVDLRRRLEAVVAGLSSLLETRRLSCTIDVRVADCHVVGDHKRIDQVLLNLLGNAIKFTPEGRRILVEVAADSLPAGRRAEDSGELPALRLTVADEGIGIPAEELDTIFDKFTQSSKTATGAGGTGLGLAICREIVHAHQGIIRARNRPDGGAAIDVILPIPTDKQP
jgi:PAS domain S-box-containing protein